MDEQALASNVDGTGTVPPEIWSGRHDTDIDAQSICLFCAFMHMIL